MLQPSACLMMVWLRRGLGQRLQYTLRLAGWSHSEALLDTESLLAWLRAVLDRRGCDHARAAAIVPLLQLTMLVQCRFRCLSAPGTRNACTADELWSASCICFVRRMAQSHSIACSAHRRKTSLAVISPCAVEQHRDLTRAWRGRTRRCRSKPASSWWPLLLRR